MQSLGYITAKQAAQAKASPVKVHAEGQVQPQGLRQHDGQICQRRLLLRLREALPEGDRLPAGAAGDRRLQDLHDARAHGAEHGADARCRSSAWANRKSVAVMDVIDPRDRPGARVRRQPAVRRQPEGPATSPSDPLNIKPAAGAGSTYKVFTLVSALQAKVPLRDFQIDVGNTYTSKICTKLRRRHEAVRDGERRRRLPGRRRGTSRTATYESINTFFVALHRPAVQLRPERSGQGGGGDWASNTSTTPTRARPEHEARTSSTAKAGRRSPSARLDQPAGDGLGVRRRWPTAASTARPTPIVKIVGPDGKQVGLPEQATCERRIGPGHRRHRQPGAGEGHQPAAAAPRSAPFGRAGRRHPADRRQDRHASARSTASRGQLGGLVHRLHARSSPPRSRSSTRARPPQPLTDVPGKEGRDVFGAYSAGDLARRARADPARTARWSFPPEDPEVVNGDSVPVPSVVGLDVGCRDRAAAAPGLPGPGRGRAQGQPAAGRTAVAEQSPSGRAPAGMTVMLYLSSGKAPAASRRPANPTRPAAPGRGWRRPASDPQSRTRRVARVAAAAAAPRVAGGPGPRHAAVACGSRRRRRSAG